MWSKELNEMWMIVYPHTSIGNAERQTLLRVAKGIYLLEESQLHIKSAL